MPRLVSCRACGYRISKAAAVCPNCGDQTGYRPTSLLTKTFAWLFALAAVTAFMVSAFSGGRDRLTASVELPSHIAPTDLEDAAESGPKPVRNGNKRSLAVSRDRFDGDWPLVVDSAEIHCEPNLRAPSLQVATVTVAGRTFALNGTAKGAGYAELGPYQLDSEEIPGTKVSSGDLLDTARRLCLASGF